MKKVLLTALLFYTIIRFSTSEYTVVDKFKKKYEEPSGIKISDGRKICTLLDKRLNAGTNTIQLGNKNQTSGIYMCKLPTLEGVSTLKLIVNS